jgi:hypothetical protein
VTQLFGLYRLVGLIGRGGMARSGAHRTPASATASWRCNCCRTGRGGPRRAGVHGRGALARRPGRSPGRRLRPGVRAVRGTHRANPVHRRGRGRAARPSRRAGPADAGGRDGAGRRRRPRHGEGPGHTPRLGRCTGGRGARHHRRLDGPARRHRAARRWSPDRRPGHGARTAVHPVRPHHRPHLWWAAAALVAVVAAGSAVADAEAAQRAAGLSPQRSGAAPSRRRARRRAGAGRRSSRWSWVGPGHPHPVARADPDPDADHGDRPEPVRRVRDPPRVVGASRRRALTRRQPTPPT